jgi:hypothetical protein
VISVQKLTLICDVLNYGQRDTVNDPSAINVAEAAINGIQRKTNGAPIFMGAFGSTYSSDDIAAVANYVTARSVPRAPNSREMTSRISGTCRRSLK